MICSVEILSTFNSAANTRGITPALTLAVYDIFAVISIAIKSMDSLVHQIDHPTASTLEFRLTAPHCPANSDLGVVVKGEASVFDLWVMLGFGLLGILFCYAQIPLAAIVIGIILGPLLENNLRRSLLISGDGYGIFLDRPVSGVQCAGGHP